MTEALVAGLAVEQHTDKDGNPSKRIAITLSDGRDITINLGSVEAGQLAAALRPNGKPVRFIGASVP